MSDEKVTVILCQEDFDALEKALADPPKANAKLRELMREQKPMTKLGDPVVVEGSWGRLHVDPRTGNVLMLTDEPSDMEGEVGYRDIARVDVRQWHEDNPGQIFEGCDILHIGFWLHNGNYVFAAESPNGDEA